VTTRLLQKPLRKDVRNLLTFLAVGVPVTWILLSLLSLPLLNDDLGDPRLLLPLWKIFAAFTIGPWVVVKKVLVIGLGVGLVTGLVFVALLALGAVVFVYLLPSLLGGFVKGATMGDMIRQPAQHARSQGRLADKELVKVRGLGGPGLPLCYTLSGDLIGIPYGEDSGHVAVVGPTRSGKGLHLTQTILMWGGPALVIDPKGEQLERTRAKREAIGPIYTIPGDSINLCQLFDPSDPNDVIELHYHTLRPWMEREPIFSEKALHLYRAAAKAENMIATLGRWANMPMPVAMAQAWELEAEATAVFTNGRDPADAVNDRFATSAWGTFTTKFAPFLPHIENLSKTTIPEDWAEQGGSIFITWPMHHLKAVGPMVSALIAGLLRQRMQRPRLPVLFAIDEAPAVALGNLADYMATVGGYGVTLLLYAQSVPQLLGVYRQADVRAVLGNCHHQVWYPPQDTETAQMVSTMFGSRIELSPSTHNPGGSWMTGTGASTRYRPALEDAQAMSLPEGAVVAITAGLRFIGQRLDPRSFLTQITTPPEIPPHEPDFPEDRRVDTFSGMDVYEEDMRGVAEEIRKAIESEEGNKGDV